MASRFDWHETSRERARGIVVRHIKPELGGYPFAALNHQLIRNSAGARSKTQGLATDVYSDLFDSDHESVATALDDPLSPALETVVRRVSGGRQIVATG